MYTYIPIRYRQNMMLKRYPLDMKTMALCFLPILKWKILDSFYFLNS